MFVWLGVISAVLAESSYTHLMDSSFKNGNRVRVFVAWIAKVFILVTNRFASGFRVCYSDGLDAAVFSTASAELCVNKLKRWTSPMMSGPHRYLSRILEVCWDINETFMTENFWFYWCPVKTRSLFFLPLSQLLWKCVIIAGSVMMSPCWLFSFNLLVSHPHFIDDQCCSPYSVVTVPVLLKYFSSPVWNRWWNCMAKQLFLSEVVWLAPPSCPHQIQCHKPALYVNEQLEQHKQVLWSHFSLWALSAVLQEAYTVLETIACKNRDTSS